MSKKPVKKFLKDKKGISPIVGVILIVAMTVMLAIIAWSYLSGMANTHAKMYNVAARASKNATGWISITYMGGPDANQVKYLNVSVSVGKQVYSIYSVDKSTFKVSPSYSDVYVSPPGGLGNGSITKCPPQPGTTVIIKGNETSGSNHVTVAATFKDGTTQTILDTWL